MVTSYGFIDIIIKANKFNKNLAQQIMNYYKVTEGHFDNNLIVVRAGMSSNDANLTAKELEEKYNLSHIKDFVFVKQFGLIDKCDWLRVNKLKNDLQIGKITYKKGTPFYELIVN